MKTIQIQVDLTEAECTSLIRIAKLSDMTVAQYIVSDLDSLDFIQFIECSVDKKITVAVVSADSEPSSAHSIFATIFE